MANRILRRPENYRKNLKNNIRSSFHNNPLNFQLTAASCFVFELIEPLDGDISFIGNELTLCVLCLSEAHPAICIHWKILSKIVLLLFFEFQLAIRLVREIMKRS